MRRDWTTVGLVRPAREHKEPVILSHEEVHRILSQVKLLRYRVCLETIYSCGLRLSEAINLQVRDIDSARGVIHVRKGKGGKDRYVPLPRRTLELLREQWKSHRNPQWIFPMAGAGHPRTAQMRAATRPCSKSVVQAAFRKALSASGIRKDAHVHTLRHSYATTLLEENVNLRQIQENLGHNSPSTTSVYTHLTGRADKRARQTLERIMNDLP